MCSGLVLLTNGTASNKVVNEHRKSGPPEVTFNNSFGMEMSKVTHKGGRMDGMKKGGPGRGWYIHMSLII